MSTNSASLILDQHLTAARRLPPPPTSRLVAASMSWFWGSSSKSSGEDPLKKLDPSLKDFLNREAREHREADAATTATPPPPAAETRSAPSAHSDTENSAPAVPAQSLFQDGRYAHLWKTYKPREQVEAESRTDQEKLNDLLSNFKDRRAMIQRAAMENCALEQEELNNCYRHGSYADIMTMCKKQNRALDKCYKTQASFLKALGYLANPNSTPELDETIQMHADKLYHQLLEQEAELDRARAEARPAPDFAPLLPGVQLRGDNAPELKLTDYMDAAQITPAIQQEWDARMKKADASTRAIEASALVAEVQAGRNLAKTLGDIYEREDMLRTQRFEDGRATIGDRVLTMLNWRKSETKPEEPKEGSR